MFDPKQIILRKIKANGGWVNAHAHIDRAYTITTKNFHLTYASLEEKWHLNDDLKRSSTISAIYDRMARALEHMINQGVTVLGTFIDVDEVIHDKAISAAQKLRDKYKKDIQIKYINQVHKGVLSEKAREWFLVGAQFVDIIGGLPRTDKGRESEHLDLLLKTAKKMNKMVHVHVDQLNSAKEKETEILVDKTLEYGMQGRVVAIHSISIAAHPKPYRQKLYQKMKKSNLMVVTCPMAWIDIRRSEELSPIHNSITPVDELVPSGIIVALGTDNIADIYKPFSEGDMWRESHLLMEACRFYEIDELVKIATINGRKVLGID